MFWRKKIEADEIVKKGMIAGFLELVFILMVGAFFFIANTFFPAGASNMILNVAMVLTLLVLGVAISGALLFGFPLYLALHKRYQEAMTFFAAAILVLIGAFSIAILVQMMF